MSEIERIADLSRLVANDQFPIYFMLHGLIQHDLYHAGQIALLKSAFKKV